MTNGFEYGDEIAVSFFAEALPKTTKPSLAVWTREWVDITGLRSTVYGLSISDDKWHFPKQLFRETSAASKGGVSNRTVDFRKLRSALPASSAEEVVRRAKRMAWIYLHAPKDAIRSTTTEVERVKKFVSVIKLLGKSGVFTHMPDDSCPDGPMFFRELSRCIFEKIIPIEKTVRNGIILLNNLPPDIDDRLRFDAVTYQKHWQKRSKEKNASQGKHAKAVNLGAVDDLNLSKLLAACNTYRGYPVFLETIWTWLEKHQIRAQETGKRTGVFRANGIRMVTSRVKETFSEEVLGPNLNNWLAAGLIEDDEGTLVAPVYSHTSLVYRNVYDIIDRNAFKTFTNSILYSNAIFLAFLTAVRSQELRSLPLDALVSAKTEGHQYDYLVGSEFKTNDQIEGISREWPLPRAAVGLITGTQQLQSLRSRTLGTDKAKSLFEMPLQIAAPFMQMLLTEWNYTGPKDNILRRMRPSSAQLVADIGRSPLSIRTVLGHANIEESLRYCHGKPDDEYRDLIAQSKLARDRMVGQEMISQVTGDGATKRMTTGVIKMGIDQIIALGLGDQVAVSLARDLQAQIDKVKPKHFSEIYEMIGEDRWQVDEFIGESVAQPRPFQFCTAKKGNVDFSGACSTTKNTINPKKCKSYCPYNYEAHSSLELRAEWIEKELSRGHFDDSEVTTEDPIFYNSAMKILDWLWGFEGPLANFKSDIRLLKVMERIAQDHELIPLFKGEARRTLRGLGVL